MSFRSPISPCPQRKSNRASESIVAYDNNVQDIRYGHLIPDIRITPLYSASKGKVEGPRQGRVWGPNFGLIPYRATPFLLEGISRA